MKRTMRLAILAMLVAAGLAGCVGATVTSSPGPSEIPGRSGVVNPGATATATAPGQSPVEIPESSNGTLGLATLRYQLADTLGRPLFCDPDFYPVARSDEGQLALERFAAIRADSMTYAAITAHLKIVPASPTPVEKLAIYRDWKMLRALALAPVGSAYSFDFIAAADSGAKAGWHVTGTIAADGTINLQGKDSSGPPLCPICLARGTRIATPSGELAVEDMAVGMSVWTSDGTGQRQVGRVVAVGSTPVLPTHLVVHLVLDDGRMLDVSPGHPLSDGRRVGDLRTGEIIDGARVVSADLRSYLGGATFDLLPSGPTGTYWANGILLASTLAP